MFTRMLRNELGGTASEYALIIGAFGLAVVGGSALLRGAVGSEMSSQPNTLSDNSRDLVTATPTPGGGNGNGNGNGNGGMPTPTPAPTPAPTATPTPTPAPTPAPSPTCTPKGNGNGNGNCK